MFTFPETYNITDKHNIAFVVIGSHMYGTANEQSDKDIKIITLEDILPYSKLIQIKFENYELSKVSLASLISGLVIGRINEVEIILSPEIIKGKRLIQNLKTIFDSNLNDSQRYTLLSNSLGVIQTSKVRKLEGKKTKVKSVLEKTRFIYNYLNPNSPYLEDDLAILESKIKKQKEEIGVQLLGTMNEYKLDQYYKVESKKYDGIRWKQYGDFINYLKLKQN